MEHGFFIRVRIEVERLAVAVHAEIAAGAVPAVGVRQLFRKPGAADLLHRRAVGGVLPDQLRAVGRNDLIVLHDEQGAAGLFRVAVQNALHRQCRPLDKLGRGAAIGQQDDLLVVGPVCRYIHGRPVCQQNALQVGLLREAEDVQRGFLFELIFQLGIADAVRCVLAQERAVRAQHGNAGEPERLGLLFQAVRVGEVECGVTGQLVHRDRRAAECFGRDGIVVPLKTGGLRFDELDRLAEMLFGHMQGFPAGGQDDPRHEEHTDENVEHPGPRVRSGFVVTRQWCPPPDTAKHVPGICRRSVPVCRPRASARRYHSAGGPTRGCRFWQRRRPAR